MTLQPLRFDESVKRAASYSATQLWSINTFVLRAVQVRDSTTEVMFDGRVPSEFGPVVAEP